MLINIDMNESTQRSQQQNRKPIVEIKFKKQSGNLELKINSSLLSQKLG